MSAPELEFDPGHPRPPLLLKVFTRRELAGNEWFLGAEEMREKLHAYAFHITLEIDQPGDMVEVRIFSTDLAEGVGDLVEHAFAQAAAIGRERKLKGRDLECIGAPSLPQAVHEAVRQAVTRAPRTRH
jgi:hypothetical protein